MIELINDFQGYVVSNRVTLATTVTLLLIMGVMVYLWIRAEVGTLTKEDRIAVGSVLGIIFIPLAFGVVAAAVVIGLTKFYEFIFGF